MKLVRAQFTNGTVNWRIRKDDRLVFYMDSLNGWGILNPLYGDLLGPNSGGDAGYCYLLDGTALVSTNELYLVPNEELDDLGIVLNVLLSRLARLMGDLRYVSRQVTIPKEFWTFGFREVPWPPGGIDFQPAGKVLVQQFLVDTAVTAAHIGEADGMPTHRTHHTLFLDAIQAFREKDYRRTLLYCAIAIETMANEKLDEEYQRVLKGTDERFRVNGLKQAGGAVVLKDPVFAFLKEKGAFSQLLHEQPLYLMGRSLLLDNPELYDTAVLVYRTRNRIAHKGVVANDEAVLSMSAQDSLKAINSVMEIFEWFREDSHYPSPTTSFVEGSTVRIIEPNPNSAH